MNLFITGSFNFGIVDSGTDGATVLKCVSYKDTKKWLVPTLTNDIFGGVKILWVDNTSFWLVNVVTVPLQLNKKEKFRPKKEKFH